MSIQLKQEGDVCIVELGGDIDANTAPDISSQVLDLAKSHRKILMD